jgi:hypothetical protein
LECIDGSCRLEPEEWTLVRTGNANRASDGRRQSGINYLGIGRACWKWQSVG